MSIMVPPRRRFVWFTMLSCAVVAFSSGCGSLVVSDGGLADGTGQDVLNPDQPAGGGQTAGPSAVGQGGGAGAGSVTGGSAPQGTGRGPGSASPGSGGPGALPAAKRSGHGFTATEIRIGFPNAPDINAVAAAAGIKGASVGNLPVQMKALADYINKHGGVVGRRITFVQHDIPVSSATDQESADRATCSDWTEDHTVFAVMSPLGAMSPQLRQCLYAHQTALLVSPTQLIPRSEYLSHPTMLFAPGYMDTDRYTRLWVNRLIAQSFTRGWDINTGQFGRAPVKLGYIGTNDPDTSYKLTVLRSELAKHGYKITDTATFAPTADAINSGTQSAVLRFRADGITHVFGATLNFLTSANSQNYFPRYAITYPAAILASSAPAGQLRGSVGAGLSPSVDVDTAQQPKDHNAAQRLCEQIMRSVGEWTNTTDTTARGYMYFECDSMFMLADAMNGAGALSLAGLGTGAEALGTRFVSAGTFTSRFGPQQHASATSMRDFTYVYNGCKCFVYTNATNHSDTS